MRLMNGFDLKRWGLIIARITIGGGLFVWLLTPSAAEATLPSCPITITSCGCVISQAGIYTVGSNLSASQTAERNCIEITARHSILNLKGAKVIGNNAGVGIFIHQQATSVIVEGGDEADNSPQAEVSQWDVGIEDDADDAIIEAFEAIGGIIIPGGHTPGNVTGGILLKKVKHSIIGDFVTAYNGKYGVKLINSSEVNIGNVTAQKNGDTGIQLDSSNGNQIGPATSAGNVTSFGVWLVASSDNTIHDLPGAGGNGDTGILIGCGPLRFERKKCEGNERTNRNRIINSGAPGNKKAGIWISVGSEGNLVTVNHNDGNDGQKMDMVDENKKCDHNTWYNNTGAGNQSCIK